MVGRAPRKRGGKASKPGKSDEQQPVLVARDRTGAGTDAMLAASDGDSIKGHLGGVVERETLLITEDEKAYAALAKTSAHLHMLIIASEGEHFWQDSPSQNVNASTSNLKIWMIRF